MYVMRLPFCWTTFLYDPKLSCIDKLYGFRLDTNCATCCGCILVCNERYFMMSLSDYQQTDIIDAFNTTSRYLQDILNITNTLFLQYGKKSIPCRAST